MSACIQPADVADADAVLVVTASVRTLPRDGSPVLDGAVEADDIVVADVRPTAAKMPRAYCVRGDVLPLARCATMQNDAFDVAHG